MQSVVMITFTPRLTLVAAGPMFESAVNEYYHTHDPLGYIGMDPNATVAAHNIHVPPTMFNFPQPPPQHCAQVSHL